MPSALPTIAGDATEGVLLTATDGVWASAGPLELVTRWQRCSATGDACTDIDGATGATYLVGSTDVGSTLRVAVTATGTLGAAEAASTVTDVVAGADEPPPAPSPPPGDPPPLRPRPCRRSSRSHLR